MSEENSLPGELDEGVFEGLMRLRDITRMTGMVHDAQILQLKFWPRIVFPCESHSIEHDGEQRLLTIRLVLNGPLPEGDDLKKCTSMFESWCQTLLGDDWLVCLRCKKPRGRERILYEGTRKTQPPSVAKPTSEDGAKFISDFRRYRNPTTKEAFAAANETLPPLKV